MVRLIDPPLHEFLPGFDELSREIRTSTGCLVIGYRDPDTGEEQVNPPGDVLVRPDMEVLYLSAEPRLRSP